MYTYAKRSHMHCSPCQEFGGLWKHPNNPPCANSIIVFTLLKLDNISIWQKKKKKKKILLIREHMAYCQWYRNTQISHEGSIIIVAVPKGNQRST